jgi:hypothetical protein
MALNEYSVPNYVKKGLILDLNAKGVTGSPSTWSDQSENGFIGTLNNFNTSTCWNNNALSLDGSNDYVSIPYDIILNPNEWSLDFYLTPKKTSNNPILYNYTPTGTKGFYLTLNSSSKWQITVGGSNLVGNTAIIDKLTHILITYKDGNLKLYENSNKIGELNVTYTMNDRDMKIGFDNTYYFNGDIYYTRMYNKALSSSEINQNYLNATNTPSDLNTFIDNGEINLEWKDKTLDSTQYRIKRNGTIISTLNKNSILLKNELKIQRWVTSPTNPMIDGGSLGTGHLYQTSLISKGELYKFGKVNSTHDITKNYATHGLVLYLDGKDGQGIQSKWLDRSGRGNNGTLNGFSYNNISGWGNGGLTQNANNSSVTIPNNTSLNPSQVTLEIFFELNSLPPTGYPSLISKTMNQYYMLIGSDGYIRTGVNNNGFSSNTKIKAHQKYHVLMIYDGKNTKLYINNVLDYTLANTGNIISVFNNIDIGTNLNGTIYLARIYNRTLSSDEITQNYKQSLPYTSDGLILHLDAQNASGTTWTDLSGNGNNGTLKNFGTSATSGWNNGALVFDGTDDYVEVLDSASLDLSGNVTVEMVVKTEQLTNTLHLFDKGNHTNNNKEFSVSMTVRNGAFGDIVLNTTYENSSVISYLNTQQGQYTHITFVKNITTGKFSVYKNGAIIGNPSTISTSTSTNSAESLWIGKDDSNGYLNFKGAIKSIKIYNKALTANEVQKNYQDAMPRMNTNTSGLILSLDARNGYGNQTTWYDGSGSGNNATLNSGGWLYDGTSGWNNGSLLFRQNNDEYIKLPTSTSLNVGTGDFSIIADFTPTATNNFSIFEKDGVTYPYIRTNTNNTVVSYSNASSNLPLGTISQSTRNHFVVKRQNGVVSIYQNGVLLLTTLADTASYDFSSFNVMKNFGMGGYKGNLNNFGIYNRALSDAEIKQLYLDQMGLNKSCILSYDFVGGSGTTVTDKLNGVVGTLNGFSSPATATSGWQSDGLLFDGTDDYIDVPSANPQEHREFTIELILTPLSLTNSSSNIIRVLNRFYLQVSSGGILRHSFNGSDFVYCNSKSLLVNVKYHILLRCDNNGLAFYINGMKEVTSSATNLTNTFPIPFSIGNATNSINAKFYSVNIYNRGLTDDEVWERYKECMPERQYVTNGLVLDLDAEGITSGTTWSDKSGYGNNGTLTNFASPMTNLSGWNKGKLVFDGTDYVTVPSSVSLNPIRISVEICFELVALPSTGDYMQLINKHSSGQYTLTVDANGDVRGAIYTTSSVQCFADTNIQINKKYHLTMTYDGAYIRIYINGVYKNSIAQTGDIITTDTTALGIGRYVSYTIPSLAQKCSRPFQTSTTWWSSFIPTPRTTIRSTIPWSNG